MPPPVEVLALNRIAFGPRAGDVERVRHIGLAAFLDEQLHPDPNDDATCAAHLKNAKLHIEYEAGQVENGKKYVARKEDRPLKLLDAPLAELWKLRDEQLPVAYEERQRPLAEMRAATWIRAIYSRWQLREVLADFWHNHFNVYAEIDDERVFVTFPIYDRDVIRRHCMGNFRQFIEAVAKSVPMLGYLNNASSRASPANENYARELFELHTLGAANYFNHLYNRWREVPGAVEEKPIGYIDQDVYEAARAFTGWTVADGSDSDRGDTFPNNGEFYYYDGWHDPYQKRVLGVEFDPNQPPMADGQRVLDLVAAHPATAAHVCGKLCRRLVGDEAPDSLLTRAVEAWTTSADQPDQIAQTVRAIVLSPEFAATWGERVKRPFDLIVSFLRATDAQVTPDDGLFGLADNMGQHLFAWPSPTGHPNASAYWLGTNAMLGRWNAAPAMMADDFTAANFRLERQTPPEANTWRKICQYWADRMYGRAIAPEVFDRLLAYVTGDDGPDAPLNVKEKALVDRITGLVGLIAMTPEFQLC